MKNLSKDAKRLKKLLERRTDNRLYVGGLVECRAALELVAHGQVEIVEGTITEEGGSGRISRVEAQR